MGENTLPEQIAMQLRRQILHGTLRPGATIKERDNAADLGVSRTPMREAIRILAKEGLVELRPARSPVVASPTLKDVTDAITVIVALEELSGKLAVEHATREEISEIRSIHERMQQGYDQFDHVERFEVDMEFHMAIARASHNVALAETHAAYLRRMWRARFLSARTRRNRERVVRQHGDIVRGLEERDTDLVAVSIHAHLGHLLDSIKVAFADAPDDARPAEENETIPEAADAK
ncbi:MAG TPA: GntR family transcriptional regulator [Rhodobacteraceae bacterium]|mgnify:FL=1|nr:GntR family transcriptional regulator [Paracoccaceae bacterium]